MTTTKGVSGWAVAWTIFAAVWMWILGFMHAIAGFAGIAEDEVLVAAPNYVLQLDTTTWGWIHLILGIVVFIAGFSLFNGAVWARTIGVVLAAISIIGNFSWLPYQPLWSILMIAAGAFVMWALTAHGHDISGTDTV